MGFLATLYLPILLSSVFVFIASSLVHMVVKWHASDYGKLPDEDKLRAAFRASGVGPGQFVMPNCSSMKDLGSPEMKAKFQEGPVGTLILRPAGPPSMGGALAGWFLYTLLIGVFVAYIASHTLRPGTPYLEVFRLTGAVAMLGYAFSYIPDSIWKGLSWSVTLKFVVDGAVYALLTAGTFGWLWPHAA